MIIVPSSLRKQWNQELADKFFLPSIILETKSFNQGIKNGNLNPFQQKDIVICSYHYADFVEDGYSFMLRENPFGNETIHPGPYSGSSPSQKQKIDI